MGNKITTIATIRPKLSLTLNEEEFLEYYYLKSELIQFAKDNNLPIILMKPANKK